MLLTSYAPWSPHFAFLNNPGPTAQGGITYSGLDPPTLVINQEMPPDVSTVQSDEAIPQLTFLLLR